MILDFEQENTPTFQALDGWTWTNQETVAGVAPAEQDDPSFFLLFRGWTWTNESTAAAITAPAEQDDPSFSLLFWGWTWTSNPSVFLAPSTPPIAASADGRRFENMYQEWLLRDDEELLLMIPAIWDTLWRD